MLLLGRSRFLPFLEEVEEEEESEEEPNRNSSSLPGVPMMMSGFEDKKVLMSSRKVELPPMRSWAELRCRTLLELGRDACEAKKDSTTLYVCIANSLETE